MRFTPILAAVALGATQLANAQGIVINCTWQNALLEDNFLGMYCNNDDWAHFAYDWTWLDTNACLTNYGGKLLPYNTGNYWSSCGNCSLRKSPVDLLLECDCINDKGSMAPASYDLNTVVYNRNGTLGCFNFLGNKTDIGPF
ncbi:hypothetical protein F4819DRAFT_392671 [Hypoxylon fuscum]|nr:hypothetical protein F4819DRAFT_392671 [Hypoxylon fuscum]